MKKIYQTLGVMSVTFLLASCSNNTQNGSEDIVNSDEVVKQMDEGTESATGKVEASEDTEDSASADSTVEENQAHQMTLKLGYGAPHGERSFSAIFVGLEGDTITNVSIDEFQFMDASEDYQGVPNSDNDFGEGHDENQVLISKVENNEAYSKLMAEKAEATNSLVEGYQAISEFAEGKTISELEEAIDDLHRVEDSSGISDVVSGATLVDTPGYLEEIVRVAKDGFEFSTDGVEDIENAELSYSLQAPHGSKSFALVGVLHQDDMIIAVIQDELQFMDDADVEGVPNSDQAFGEAYHENSILISKRANTESYSELMVDKGNATMTYDENHQAISEFVVGMTVQELQEVIDQLAGKESEETTDTVSGATFADETGYLEAILNTIQ
ncbi:peptidoglycan-binding protein [Dolosigranulum pigrum]|uniref:peptidoglycan-binding protein n=1 Tax=Dolosigranulum pigrum TaxID=29394 RepID=UPI001AD85C2C|nr:peptidoglycan-binding protein [Dolosigranulum pigrum]QTJ56382.1 peptidoglycan-binding protein [Dolosigranulum pigrum]